MSRLLGGEASEWQASPAGCKISIVVVVKHADGRVVILAKEHGLKPMEWAPVGGNWQWQPCTLGMDALDDFVRVDATEAKKLLSQAQAATKPRLAEAQHSSSSGRRGAAPRSDRASRALDAQPVLGPNKD